METFIWSIIFGIIGMGYFSFGRKRDSLTFVFSGLGLMLFPYLIGGLTLTIVVGAGLILLPFAIIKYIKSKM